MFDKLFKKKVKPKLPKIIKTNPIKKYDGWFVAASTQDWQEKYGHLINTIYRGIRLEEHHVDIYYRPVIERLIRYAQALPASEYSHHSYPGGLLEHTLEVAKTANMYRREVLYSESGKETEVENQADIFAYACFTASIMHDIGKILCDLEVVFRENEECKPQEWIALKSAIPIGYQYKYRYNPNRINGTHESASPLLVQSIIPIEGIYWLKSRPRLWQKWISCIAGDYVKGAEVGQVVKFADSTSAAANFVSSSSLRNKSEAGESIANSGQSAAEMLLKAMRQAIESSDLPLNKAGAAGWCFGDNVYMVSQRTVQVCRTITRANGYTALPKNDVTLFAMLCDAGISQRHPETDDLVQTYEITTKKSDNTTWVGQLTFLVIPKQVLDPNNTLNLVDADIQLVDMTMTEGKNAKANTSASTKANKGLGFLEANSIPKSPEPPKEASTAQQNNTPDDFFSSFMNPTEIAPQPPSSDSSPSKLDKGKDDVAQNREKVQSPAEKKAVDAIDIIVKPRPKTGVINPFGTMLNMNPSEQPQHNESDEFLSWLKSSIKDRTVEFNTLGSICLNLHEGFFVASPSIFDLYNSFQATEVDRNSIIRDLKNKGHLQTSMDGSIRKVQLNNESNTVLTGVIIKHPVLDTSKEKTISASIITVIN